MAQRWAKRRPSRVGLAGVAAAADSHDARARVVVDVAGSPSCMESVESAGTSPSTSPAVVVTGLRVFVVAAGAGRQVRRPDEAPPRTFP